MGSILAVYSGVERIGIGSLTKYWSWLKIVSFCLVGTMLLILFILSKLGPAGSGG
ncbi:hypothetical protein [Bacteroidetes bacterium endosymbiont of Geopemphigus sp.]|uniref:hypothetical protein n=1 Tax=Bacteroidetes bacterium endosymbiont of Geopemphigus sp. TaxID=2047937 RepID=UPI0018A80B7C|nr:hypothetical protein [Bacteroidetes bacterium endosymbiont of Geopemphigus sp.]